MKREGRLVAYLYACSVIGLVFAGSLDVFEDFKTLSFLESDAGSPSSPVAQPLMVDLTLIQGADSKGAGTTQSLIYPSIGICLLNQNALFVLFMGRLIRNCNLECFISILA